MVFVVLVQGSLNPNSNTAIVISEIDQVFNNKEISTEIIDLRKLQMEFCDGRKLEKYSDDIQKSYATLEKADAVIFGMPVYCWSVSGPLKNFIDIIADSLEKKPIGIACNAGGNLGYLAAADLAKILSFEVEAQIVHPIPYTYKKDFENGKLVNPIIKDKINDLVTNLSSFI